MPNLAKTQGQFDALADRIGLIVGMAMEAIEQRDRYELSRTRVRQDPHGDTPLSGWTINGFLPSRVALEEGRMRLFIRVFDEDPGAGEGKVRGYLSDAARTADAGAHVFTGSALDGDPVTLATANNSGLSGTVLLGVAADRSDIEILLFADWVAMIAAVFDGTLPFDELGRDVLKVIANRLAAKEREKLTILSSGLRDYLRAQVSEFVNKDSSDAGSAATSLVNGGEVTTSFTGIMARLADVMGDNTTPQTFLQHEFAAPAGAVFDTDNGGKGTVPTLNFLNNVQAPGTIDFELATEISNIGPETFNVVFKLDGRKEKITAERRLTVGKTFRSPKIGVSSMLLRRTIEKSGDGTHVALADPGASLFTVSGETTGNISSDFKLGVRVVTGAVSDFDIEFHNVTDPLLFTTSTLVAKASTIADDDPFTASAQNSSGLTVVGVAGSGLVNLQTAILLLNPWRFVEASGEIKADHFQIVVEQGEDRGKFLEMLQTVIAVPLPSAAAGAETIDDARATRNAYAPFRDAIEEIDE